MDLHKHITSFLTQTSSLSHTQHMHTANPQVLQGENEVMMKEK